jgi:hypothetical protein
LNNFPFSKAVLNEMEGPVKESGGRRPNNNKRVRKEEATIEEVFFFFFFFFFFSHFYTPQHYFGFKRDRYNGFNIGRTGRPTDRTKECPFLLRCFVMNRAPKPEDFVARLPPEVHIYTYRDVNLAELCDLVKSVDKVGGGEKKKKKGGGSSHLGVFRALLVPCWTFSLLFRHREKKLK